jgi:hypothetical protein
VAVAFVLGLFMDILDTTIVNVALPTLRPDRRKAAPDTLEPAPGGSGAPAGSAEPSVNADG